MSCILKSCLFLIFIIKVAYSQIVLTANSTVQTETSSLQMTCTLQSTLSDFVYWKKRSSGAESESHLLTTVVKNTDQCTFSPATPPSYLECSCRSREHTCVIKNLTLNQDGDTWRCVGAYTSGAEVSSTYLTVQIFIPISSVAMTSPSTDSVAVVENSTQTFICQTDWGKPAATVTWHKSSGSSGVNISSGIASSQSSNGDGTIKVTSTLTYTANRADTGYRVFCRAINGANVLQSARQPLLDIMFPPSNGPVIQGLSGPNAYKMIRGSTTQQHLTCSITGGYPLPTLSWNCYGGVQNGSTQDNTATLTVYWTAGMNEDASCTCTALQPQTDWTLPIAVPVSVLYPPSSPSCRVGSATLTDGTIRVIRERVFNIACNSTSNPFPTYTWTLPGGGNVTYHALSIPRVQTGGTYSLSVRNTMEPSRGANEPGIAGTTFNLDVLEFPTSPIFHYGTSSTDPVIPNNHLDVIMGTQFSVTCVAIGNPVLTYTWNGSSQTWSTTALNNLTKTCRVTNTLNPTGYNPESGSNQTQMEVIVMFPPGVIECTVGSSRFTSGSVLVIQGSTFNIRCDSTSFPAPHNYTWTLPDGGTRPGPALLVQDIQSVHTNQYQVAVKNKMVPTVGGAQDGTNLTMLDIQLLYPPIIQAGIHIQGDSSSSTSSVNDSYISTVENSTFTLSFSVTPGYPTATTYSWSRRNGSTSSPNQAITFTNIKRSEADFYDFKAVNPMKPTGFGLENGTASNNVYINVKYRSAITAFLANDVQGNVTIEAAEGSPFKLTCVTDSNPLPKLTLTRNGAVVQEETSVRQLEYNKQKSSCEYEMGKYTCLSQNELNLSPEMRTLHYYVLCKPRLSPFVQPISNVTGSLRSSANISVTLISYPAPNYTWQKLSETGWNEVEQSTRISIVTSDDKLQSNVNISEIHEEDFGSYRVIANNSQGGISIVLYFQSSSKPEPVNGLDYLDGSVKETSAVITWSPGFDGGLPQTFVVLLKKATDNSWSAPMETKVANITLTDLQPGTEYQVKVFAQNSIGQSEHTEPISFTTLKTEKRTLAPIIGGAVGGGVGSALIIVVVVVVVKKCRNYKGHSSEDKLTARKQRLVNEDNQHSLSIGDIPDEVENPSYISAGDITNASAKPEAQTAKKKSQKPSEPMYSEPIKKKKDAFQSPEGETYAVVKKGTNDKKKKKSGSKSDDQKTTTSYDNTGFTDTIYENHELQTKNETPKNVSKDGLIYAELDFPNQPKGQKRLVIHGLDDMTVYTEVDLTKKAEPLPESDTENPKKDN